MGTWSSVSQLQGRLYVKCCERRPFGEFVDEECPAYQFPNDEREQERLDLVHEMFFLAMEDRLYLAPLKDDISSILDIGTGTGIWAMQMGRNTSSQMLVVAIIC